MTEHVFVLGAKRTPIGSFQGALSHRSSPELEAHAIQAAVDHAGVDADSVDEVTLVHALGALGGKRGVASLCIGGGEATAITIEGV